MLHGDYRKVFTRPIDLKGHVCSFSDKDADLLKPFVSVDELAKQLQDGGNHQAILLEFKLQKSSYATMLIREVCHVSSSFENQELVNNTVADD